MAKVLLQNANLLMLDEPTNHLDLPSKQMLLEALQQYQGTILFVSHDRDFVEHLADALLVFESPSTVIPANAGTQVTYYPGDYATWQFDRAQKQAAESPVAAVVKPRTAAEKPKNDKKKGALQRQLKKAEERVERAEAAKENCAHALGEHEYGTPAYEQALAAYERAEKEVSEATHAWEQLYE
jgi:ATP-binding cassette subfamily F protein 3